MSVNEQSVFAEALEIQDRQAQAAFLDRVCAGDPNLRANVESLLSAYGAGEFLESPAPVPVSPVDKSAFTEHAGTAIGPYKLLEQIGEGGFGVVFLAEQQPLRRKVALKVIKPGMDTRQVVARFEAERQALAMMDHPNIAHVLDAGATDSGRPYFVMDLICGLPITQFCDENQLTPRERLELFVTVCQAVQHAHQKGIIHRDLKPSNVLVTLQDDGTPLVKVIDFGIAKALGQERLTDKTLFTGLAHMLGTPLYMSPEQAERSGQDADTRSDIYALGVLLYELLTGTTPFDKERLKQASYEELRRIIREEEPAKPSTRISTLGQAATTVAAYRKSEPRQLSRLCRGELDWIVMKALEKDRNRRYESASALAADVQRYLHDEPVQACPPSAMYRFGKFARRNKPVVVMASFGGVAALALAVAGVALFFHAKLQKSFAETDKTRQLAMAALDEARLARANSGWNGENMTQVEGLLDACAPDRRGWEWHYLKRLCHAELLTLRGHTGSVTRVAYRPDGTLLASASEDGTVKIWDPTTGQEVRTLTAHLDRVNCVAFSPDGTRLASAGMDGTVRIWNAKTGAPLATFSTEHDRAGVAEAWKFRTAKRPKVYSLSWSPDGTRFAWCGFDDTVYIREVVTGRMVHSLSGGHTDAVHGVAFSADGTRLASGSRDTTVVVWDVTSGQRLYTLKGHSGAVWCVAFSPDGTRLASSSTDRTLKVWDAKTGQEVLTVRGHGSSVESVAFSPDGARLASGSADGAVKVWDARTGQLLVTQLGHTSTVVSVAFSPDGTRLATASADRTLKLWSATTGSGARLATGHAGLCVAALSPDGTRLALPNPGRTVTVWDAHTCQQLLTLEANNNDGWALAFSPDGTRLVSTCQDGRAFVWDAHTGQKLPELKLHAGIYGIAFRPDGKLLASASADQTVKLWDVNSGHELHTLEGHTDFVRGIAFSPDGKLLASASMDRTVRVWNVTTGKEVLPPLKGHTLWIRGVAFSPDGTRIASCGYDNTVRVWDTSTGQEVFPTPLTGHTSLVFSVAFSPDGHRLASGSHDQTVKVWNAHTGQDVLTLKGHRDEVQWVGFSPDGARLASVSLDAIPFNT